MRFIILDFCINVHSRFAIFMPGEILNGFGVYAHIQKICNVGVPELVRGYMEVQTIHMVWEAFPMASENGVGHITDVFSVHILVADFLSCGVTFDMVPNTHKFPLRKGATLTI